MPSDGPRSVPNARSRSCVLAAASPSTSCANRVPSARDGKKQRRCARYCTHYDTSVSSDVLHRVAHLSAASAVAEDVQLALSPSRI